MKDWSIPLALASTTFFAFLLWRVRPSFPWSRRPASREALRAAQARVKSAANEKARALALCDAADIANKRLGARANAAGLYLRAMRADPSSVEVVERATSALASRPRALESLLWRRLAASTWSGAAQAVVLAAIGSLQSLYEGPLRNPVRARAMAHAREALGSHPGDQKTLGSA
jgi:hypothetical protein